MTPDDPSNRMLTLALLLWPGGAHAEGGA